MEGPEATFAIILVDEEALELQSFASACETDVQAIQLMIDEGLVHPERRDSGIYFNGEALSRARRVLRLQRDFDANLQSVAVMIDLLDEIDLLRRQLCRLGKLGV
jgi:chaperone modulatory protein CbpM